MPSGVYVREPWMGTCQPQTESRPDTLTRQQYATRKIQALQRDHPKALSFKDLLDAFRWLGKHYDKGLDLRSAA